MVDLTQELSSARPIIQLPPPFPNHSIMHGAGKFGLTQLANVSKLPETGSIVIATPLKIEHGSGSPVRVIAIMPSAAGAGR